MAQPIRVGVAVQDRDERARVAEWLTRAEMTVEMLVGACAVDPDVAVPGLGCVVADGTALARGYLARLRRQDPRLPVVALVDASDEHDASFPSGVSVVARPFDAGTLALQVALAFGEGRRARKGTRRVAEVPSKVGSSSATIVDISADGVRLALPRSVGAALSPHFRLQVAMVALDVVMRRVWVRPASGGTIECGAVLADADPSQHLAWQRIIDLAAAMPAPRPATARKATRPATVRKAATTARGVRARVSDLLGAAAFSGWSHHLSRAR